MANETTIYLAVYGDLHVGTGSTPELAREHALANGSEDDGDLQVALAGSTVLDRVLRGEDPGPLELRDGVFERDSLFETRDEEYSSAAEMHLGRLLNAANERGIRTQADLLALAEELGIEATDYDDGVMLYLDDSDPVVRFDGTRWVEAKGQMDLARLADLLRQADGLSVPDVLSLAERLGFSADEYDEGAVVVWVGDREDYLVPQGDRWVLYAPGDPGPSVVVQGADGVWREVPEGEV